MKTHVEEVLKASQSANLLVADIRQAHKRAIRENPLLEISLRDLLHRAREMERELKQLDAVLTQS